MRIFDLHCDTFTELFERKTNLLDDGLAVNISGLSSFETAVQTFAVWLGEHENEWLNRYKSVLKRGQTELKKLSIPVQNGSKLLSLTPLSAILSVEGGVPFCSTEFLEQMFYDGVRTVSLTWNYDNPLAGGALGDGSLTNLGKDIICKMNELHMVTDASHLNRKSFFEVANLADNFVATHSCIDSIVPHKRNLTDEQLDVLRQKNGLLGICLYPTFLGIEVFENFYRTVCYCFEKGLENCLAIGSDFDGAVMSEKLNCLGKLALLWDYLIEKGIPEVTVDKIFFKNAYNFYDKVLTK